jgi:hypothetical protein
MLLGEHQDTEYTGKQTKQSEVMQKSFYNTHTNISTLLVTSE